MLIVLASLLFALNSQPALGNEILTQFERFQPRQELAPEALLVFPEYKLVEEYENFSQFDENGRNGEKKREGNPPSRLRVNFSRMVTGGERVDPLEQDKASKWSMLKSLPDTFQGASSSQEKFEAVGKIFEPKLSLGVEF